MPSKSFFFLLVLLLLFACAPAPVPPISGPLTSTPSAATLEPTTVPPTTAPTANNTPAPTNTSLPVATATPAPLLVKQIDTRPGVTMRFVLSMPGNAQVALIMFPGGDGRNMFQVTGDTVKLGGNFLVRTTPRFVEQGFAAAVLDVPSDRSAGESPAFRTSADHAQDISKLIDYFDKQGVNSVYLIGTSNGTLSVAYLGSVLNDPRLKGIVLTSVITGKPGEQVYTAFNRIALGKINVPVLMVHHHDDGCPDSSFAAAVPLPPKMTASPNVDFIEVNGGSPPQSGPCDPFAPHGFFGMETPVIQAIADWINGKSVPAKIGP